MTHTYKYFDAQHPPTCKGHRPSSSRACVNNVVGQSICISVVGPGGIEKLGKDLRI